MAATVTLSTTNLTALCGLTDRQIAVASTTGITPGIGLFIDGELLKVVSLGVTQGLGTIVFVLRAQGGTRAERHDTAKTIYIGRLDQFYAFDPVGHPPEVVLVIPHINLLNGNIWWPQGDEAPVGLTERYWLLQQESQAFGALGVRQNTFSPNSSQ